MENAAISLFSGAGGLDLGIEKAGFSIRACIDIDRDRCGTLESNTDWTVLNEDIQKVGGKQILKVASLNPGEVDIVVGGPPCEPFSKSAYWIPGRVNSALNDPRARLLNEFARIVIEIRPKMFLLENVPALTFRPNRIMFDTFVKNMEKNGYNICWKVLNAADYGVPQIRKRLFIVGSVGNMKYVFPEPEFGIANRDNRKPYVTAAEAIADLEDKDCGEEKINGKWGHLMELIPPGGNYLHLTKKGGCKKPAFKWRSRYWSFLLKLHPEKPSWTIQAQPGPYTGPFHWTNRRLTICEIKRLQTFPDDWQFIGSQKSIWSQIGDAVPPLLAKKLGESLASSLENYEERSSE